MGLDTSHGCWHGAYSAFSRWRDGLAKAAGYEIIEGGIREDGYVPPTVNLDWSQYSQENYLGEWPGGPPGEDPLLVLIVHSDCGGMLPTWCLKPLADRLEGLLGKLPEEPDGGHIGDWSVKTKTFIAGLREAAALGEEVEFG
jgi:hypothetical protein